MSKKSYKQIKFLIRLVSVALFVIAAVLLFTPKVAGISLFDLYTNKELQDPLGIFSTRKTFFWLCLVGSFVLPMANEYFDFKEEFGDDKDDEDDDD